MTDRGETDRICRKWLLILQLIERRALIRNGVMDTWRRFTAPRTDSQQREIDTVLAVATHQLDECDRIEQRLKAEPHLSPAPPPNSPDSP